MKVILAGFNVDLDALSQCKKKDIVLTPESISAAYARISRSPKPVDRLRQESCKEVAKARRSNRTIIFEMGHHSIAEHAVFNFDIIGISRLAVEELEKFRLCSYTEKSQRYVTLKGDFVIPTVLKNSSLKNDYLNIIKLQNGYYRKLYKKISAHNLRKNPGFVKKRKNEKILKNSAKEDARYILSLATQAQLGATINARNLELMIRRFASHNLKEINEFGKKLYMLVHKIAPSVILFHKANDYDQKTYLELQEYARRYEVMKIGSYEKRHITDVELVDYTPDGDNRILAALLFRVSKRSYRDAITFVRNLSKKKKVAFFKKSCERMELYDVLLREFEFTNLTFSLIVSAGCFGQLKRHRIASISCQGYEPELGLTIPESVIQVGEEKEFTRIAKKSTAVYKKIEKKHPGVGSYILTNAHRKRVLLSVNLRELYHISRLREDPTAQWDIRYKANKMSALAKKVMPIATLLLGGKSDYPKIYQTVYGKKPKITGVPSL
ncbi:MAG: FAD-dependent thymidylate synthase [bacterium]